MSSRRSIQRSRQIDSSSFRRSAKLELRSTLAVCRRWICKYRAPRTCKFLVEGLEGWDGFPNPENRLVQRAPQERGSTVVQACNRVFTPMEAKEAVVSEISNSILYLAENALVGSRSFSPSEFPLILIASRAQRWFQIVRLHCAL